MDQLEQLSELPAGVPRERSAARSAEVRLKFLAEASELLASSLDYQETLASLARLAVPYLGDWCGIDMVGDDGSLQRLAVQHIDPAKIAWAHELHRRYPPDPTAVTGVPNVIRTGTSEFYPLLTEDIVMAAARDDEERQIIREIGFSSAMIVPLIARERTLGAISFVAAESGYHYTPEDLSLAESLARLAAISADNARLYREAQQAREHLRVRERQQAAVARLGQQALSGIDLPGLMQEGVATVAGTLGIELCSVLELLPEEDRFVVRSGSGWDRGVVGSWTIDAGNRTQAGRTLLGNAPIIVEDARTESRFDYHQLLRDHKVVTIITVVIHGPERPFGVLEGYSRTSRRFTEDDRNFLQAIANVIGDAVERKKGEDAIRVSEIRFRTMIEQSPLSMQFFTPAGDHIQANQAWEELWGTSRQALSGYNILHDPQLVANGTMPYIMKGFAGEPTTTPPVRYDPADIGRSGRPRWVQAFIYPVRGAGEEIREVVLVLEDVSQQILAEEALQHSRDQLKVILNGVTDGVTAQDPSGRLIYANDAAARITGFPSAAELLSTPLQDLMGRYEIHDLQGKPFPMERFPGRRALLGEADAEEFLSFNIIETGEQRWSVVRATPVFDKQRKVQLAINIFRDVTDQLRSEEALRSSERKLRLIAQNTTDTIFAYDMERRLIYVNPAVEQLTGFTIPELTGQWFINRFHPEDESRMRGLWEDLFRGESYAEEEFRIITADGRTRWCHCSFGVLRDEEGLQIGVQGRERDITERREADEQLHLRFKQLQAIYDLSNAVSRAEELDQIYAEVLDSLKYTMGADRASLLLAAADGVLHLKAWRGLSESFCRQIDGHNPWEGNRVDAPPTPLLIEDIDADLAPGPLTASLTAEGLAAVGYFPLIYKERLIGDLILYYDAPHHFSDIDLWLAQTVASHIAVAIERKQAEEALRFQSLLLGAVQQGVIATDLRGRIIYWNSYAEKLYGWRADEVAGENILDIVPANPERSQALQVMEMLRRGENWTGETIVRRRDGSVFPAIVTDAPVYDDRGERIGIIGISIDISEQKQAELELKRAKEAAEAADRAKGQFLAVLSHELRTPLTPVVAMVHALTQDYDLSDELRSNIEIIRRNVELEARLIDDLLDLTRIAKGKLQLSLEAVDAHEILNDVVKMCRDDLSEKRQLLEVMLRAVDHFVMADSARLHQIFWNLLKNASKFTPEAKSIAIRTSNDTMGRLIVEIIDSGIGIEPAVLPRIFDAFEQGEQTITRQFGGLGLGLAISKTLVDLHGGTLTAESNGRGTGATFTVILPVVTSHRRSTNGVTAAGTPAVTAARILVVDDHADTSAVMKLMLERRGYEVRTADSIVSALQAAAEGEFDLLISDIGLPDGTGLELVGRIRSMREIPAIALSGFGMDEDIRRSIAAGFSEHLTKPVSFQRLHQVIHSLMNSKR